MTYNLMIRGELRRDRLAAALAALLSLPEHAVDVAGADVEERNWAAPVSCTYEPAAGDVDWLLDVYLDPAVARQPAEPDVASWLARQLRTVVLYPGESFPPSVRWLVGADGLRVRARVDEGEEETPTYRIAAVEYPVAELPGVPVVAMPEVIREHRMPTPVTDWLREWLRPWLAADAASPGAAGGSPEAVVAPPAEEGKAAWHACTRLGAWEGMVARLTAGWPPDGWYPATYYREDLEYRDELVGVEPALPEPGREPFATALAEVDRRFTALTMDDGGSGLAAELGDGFRAPDAPDRWWWRRVPRPLPWERQPGRAG